MRNCSLGTTPTLFLQSKVPISYVISLKNISSFELCNKYIGPTVSKEKIYFEDFSQLPCFSWDHVLLWISQTSLVLTYKSLGLVLSEMIYFFFKDVTNQKQEFPRAALFLAASRQNEEFLWRTSITLFVPTSISYAYICVSV